MSNIPCSLNCLHQVNGICANENSLKITCADGECPHFESMTKNEKDAGEHSSPAR